jgi:hypothetical protein
MNAKTEQILTSHTEACSSYSVDMALENGASMTDGDAEARDWAATYLDDSELCICDN